MAWRIVKQPNGLLARFSTVIDSFTHVNMNEAQAYRACREYLGKNAARRKVKAGIADLIPRTIIPSQHGLARWNDDIKTIRWRHGDKEADKFIKICSAETDRGTGQ